MLKSFTWKHALALLVMVCLLSLLAGAVLAQDEPDLPEPEVPVFDLSGSVAEPAEDPVPPAAEVPVFDLRGANADSPEPDLPEAANPLGSAYDPAAASTPINLMPNTIVPTLTATYTWGAVTGSGTITYEWELYGMDDIQPLTATGGFTLKPGALPISSAIGFTPTTFDSAYPLADGKRFLWRVRGVDNDGPGEWSQATFIVDVPRVYPEDGQEVITTTPVISWLPVQNAQFYNLEAVVHPVNAPGTTRIPWTNWYAAEDIPQAVYGIAFEGICAFEQCKVRPENELIPVDLVGQGDVEVEIRIRHYVPGPNNTVGTISNWSVLTTFTILVPPQINVTLQTGENAGRPTFTAPRFERPAEDISGLTFTARPDYYRLISYNPNAIIDLFQIVDQWFTLGTCDTNDICQLIPVEGRHKLHYEGNYQLYSRGYILGSNSYTTWGIGNNFAITTANTPRPDASDMQFLGLYEQVGSQALNPNPMSQFSEWVPCAAGTDGPVCNSSRPILHFQVNATNYSGEWINIIAWDRDRLELAYNMWLNAEEPQTSPQDRVYWNCKQNSGALSGGGWQYPETTCFFQPGLINDLNDGALDKGTRYTWYMSSYGPTGQATGGIANSGYIGPDTPSDPNDIANFRILGANPPTGLGVTLEAPDDLTSTLVNFTGTHYVPPVTATLFTGEPRFYWNEVPSASFYQLQVQTSTGDDVPVGGIADLGWYLIGNGPNMVRCDNGVCSLTPGPGTNFFVLNGNYEWTVRYWDGALSEFAPEAPMAVSIGPAQAPVLSSMQVFLNETLTGTITPVFRWQHAQNNTWYNIRVFNSSGQDMWEQIPGVVDGVWFRALDICHPVIGQGMVCEVRPELIYFALEGNYTWTVTGFSPDLSQAQSQPANFSVNDDPTGQFTPLYPVTDAPQPLIRTLTDTVKFELIFERSPNASWYNVLLIEKDSAGVYGDIIVFDWYYLPEVGEYQYPAGALNHCGGSYTYGNQTYSGDNICRIIPTTTDDDGNTVPIHIWENGTYSVFIRAFGPSGFNTGPYDAIPGGEGWRGPFDFRYDIPRSDPVDMSTIRNQDGVLLNGAVVANVSGFQWDAVEIARFYRIEIYDAAPDGSRGEIRVDYGIFPEDAGCGPASSSNRCSAPVPSTAVVDFGPTGAYYVRIGTWADMNGFVWPANIDDLFGYPPAGQLQYAIFVKP